MKRLLPSVLAGVLLCLLGGLAWADGLGPIRSGFTQAVADARYLLLSGGALTGAVTSTAQIAASLTPAAAGGLAAANVAAFEAAGIKSTVNSAVDYTPMATFRNTGVTSSEISISSNSLGGTSPLLNFMNSGGNAYIGSVGSTLYLISSSGISATVGSTGVVSSGALTATTTSDLKGSISNSGASNGGAVHVADTLTVTGDITTNGEIKSTATGAFFYISGTTPTIAGRPDRVDLYVAARSPLYQTWTNCTDSAGAAACTAAPAGSVVIDAGATTVVVSTTAVTANSQVFVQEDPSLATKLGGITCNTVTGRTYTVTARAGGTSFTITSSAAPATDRACLSYFIVN